LETKVMSTSKSLHRELAELGRPLGFGPLKVSGLEFDLYKNGVAVELLWGDGSEVWKDLCKAQIAKKLGVPIKKLIILCRIYPHKSMTGYSYVKNAVQKMMPVLENIEVDVIEIKSTEDLKKFL